MALRLSAAAPELVSDTAPDTVAPAHVSRAPAGAKLRLEARAALAARRRARVLRALPAAPTTSRTSTAATRRAWPLEVGPARVSPPTCPSSPARSPSPRRAIELLEAEPREPGFLNVRRRRLLRARRARRRRAPVPGRPPPRSRSRARREQPRPSSSAAAARRLQPPPLPAGRPRRAAHAGRARQARRRGARPAEGLTLSLCMIVKDEEEMLPRCLAAVRDAVDEIVIVDTGSKDRTREIAREFGAKVIDFEWTGSFSDARNVSFDAATGDWLMLPGRGRGPRRGRRRAPARPSPGPGARPTTCWRRTTRARWRTAPPSPTTPCASSATARACASRAGSTSRSPSTCPRSCPSASRSPTCGSTTTATSARSATRRRSRAATSSCSSARSPRGSTARSSRSTSARSTPPPATPPRRWRSSSPRGRASATTSTSPPTASCRRSPAASSARCG